MSTFIIPEKGRNSSICVERELPDKYESKIVSELINGYGKLISKYGESEKTGMTFDDLKKQVSETGCVSMKENDRRYPRPVFTRLDSVGKVIEGFSNVSEVWEKDPDVFYAGYDQFLEAAFEDEILSSEELSKGIEKAVEVACKKIGYKLIDSMGNVVKWAVMSGDEWIPRNPEKVLVSSDFIGLGKSFAKCYFEKEPDIIEFENYFKNEEELLEEEEIIKVAEEERIPGIYMYVSGNTAKRNGLVYEPIFRNIKGSISRLGKFYRSR